jgi:hypothetical protein
MPNDALAKIRRQAKKIVSKTGRSYQSALKQAGKMYREGKISGVRKKKSSSKKRSIGKRASPSRRSHRVGMARPEGLQSTLADARHKLQMELGWNLAAQRTAATKKEKKGLQPRINDLTKKLRALKA